MCIPLSSPFSRITEKKSLGNWMGTWICCLRSLMSFSKYLALRGSRAGGLFPARGKLDTLVRDDLRVSGFGQRTNTLCWCQYKDPVENSPCGPLKPALPQVPVPSAAAFIPLSFMIPAMKLGRNCRWMFQMYLYRHSICRSRGELAKPVCW